MMTAPRYILCSTGGITVPQLDICVWADTDDQARERAAPMAVALSAGPYHSHELFFVGDATSEEQHHRRVCRISVETTRTPTMRP